MSRKSRSTLDALKVLMVAAAMVAPAASVQAQTPAPKGPDAGTTKPANPCGPSNPCGPAKKKKKSGDNPCGPANPCGPKKKG